MDASKPGRRSQRGAAVGRDKPPYRVPSMEEVRSVRQNGFRVVSTFSGCGGSCLGFRMAGFRILWANEFVEEARKTYAANAAPYTVVDGRDIRTVVSEEILDAVKLRPGELEVMEGSPPCSSFSTAGKREVDWGKSKKYSDVEQRTDDLFFEFARLLAGIRPKVFVAENVSGLVKGKARGYFLEIYRALAAAGYVVNARLLDAQWLGVPQQRQRLIFVGVRNDLAVQPAYPTPLPHRYSIADALEGVSSIGLVTHVGGYKGRPNAMPLDRPAPTLTAQGFSGDDKCTFKVYDQDPSIEPYAIGAEWSKLRPGEQSNRYFSLVRPDPDLPCPTVTATAGNVGAAGVTHPTQKRKFTIAELRRISSFPDDFVLTGSYAQQWERLGRSVPPLMMRAVAEVVRDRILRHPDA